MYWFLIFLHCISAVFAILSWREHPLDKIIFEGQTVTFRCQLLNAGLSTGEHQHWVRLTGDSTKQTFISDNNILSSYVDYHVRSRFALSNNLVRGYYQLTITNANAWDNGKYGCMIYGKSTNRRAMSEFGHLRVVPRSLPRGSPVCSFLPAHPKPGSLAEFSCTSLVAGTSATNLTWSDGTSNWIPTQVSVSVSTTSRSVSFHRILGDVDNHAKYTCTERWPVPGSEVRTCSVVPFDIPLNVTITPQVQRVPYGQHATFHCLASAVPPPSQYFWYYEGYPVEERRHMFEMKDGGKTLHIGQVSGTLNNQYEIRCRAGNGIDTLRTAIAYLYILDASAPRPSTSTPSAPHNNNTDTYVSGGKHSNNKRMEDSQDNSAVTILLGITCAIGAIILILLALLLIVCQRSSAKRDDIPPEPVARSDSLRCKEISMPLTDVPLRSVKNNNHRRSDFARSTRRTIRHSYQPLKKGYVRRKGSTVSLGTGAEASQYTPGSCTSSIYENATPLRLSFPEEAIDNRDSTSYAYANNVCDSMNNEYANSTTHSPPAQKSKRKTSFGPISL